MVDKFWVFTIYNLFVSVFVCLYVTVFVVSSAVLWRPEIKTSPTHWVSDSVTIWAVLDSQNRSKCFEIALHRILYGCDRTVASVSFHPVEIGRKGIFGQVQSIQNAPLFNQLRQAQTWNSSNFLHEQDFQFVWSFRSKTRKSWREEMEEKGGCFIHLFWTNCSFFALKLMQITVCENLNSTN